MSISRRAIENQHLETLSINVVHIIMYIDGMFFKNKSGSGKVKTPLLNGVSLLNWRKRVRIELTYDITATHQL